MGALRDGYPGVEVGTVTRVGSRKAERVPQVVRLDVARTMPFYIARLNCGHNVFERLAPCVAHAFLTGTVVWCTVCREGRDV